MATMTFQHFETNQKAYVECSPFYDCKCPVLHWPSQCSFSVKSPCARRKARNSGRVTWQYGTFPFRNLHATFLRIHCGNRGSRKKYRS